MLEPENRTSKIKNAGIIDYLRRNSCISRSLLWFSENKKILHLSVRKMQDSPGLKNF